MLEHKNHLLRRLKLRRADGRVFLNRWGVFDDRIGGIFLHRMDAPDPGVDLHDHPFSFVSIILWGGYTEERCETRRASARAGNDSRGDRSTRRWLSVRSLRLDECHRIIALNRKVSWSLLLMGPRRRSWGFYLPTGYMPEDEYNATVRADRRDLWEEIA